MFYPEKCTLCGDCLVRCQWMDVDQPTAEKWMAAMMRGEETPAVSGCITCYACNEYCPEDARPFDLIAELQEKYSPPDRVAAQEERYAFSGEIKGAPSGEKRIMTTCVFGRSDPHLIQGPIYDLPAVGGKPYFCWVLFSHMGGVSVEKRRAQEFVDRLAATGAEEVICFHDDCYAMLTELAPEYGVEVPFRPVHLAEYLVEYLKENQNRIIPLDRAAAYQRPCASRHTPEKEHYIDELFRLCGVRRVDRTYDRENALCCAGVKFLLKEEDPAPDQEKNLVDARRAGAEALVCLCPMCMHSLADTAKKEGLPLVFLGDLARMALGEAEFPGAVR